MYAERSKSQLASASCATIDAFNQVIGMRGGRMAASNHLQGSLARIQRSSDECAWLHKAAQELRVPPHVFSLCQSVRSGGRVRGLPRDSNVAGLWALLALHDLEFDLGALVEDGATRVVGVDKYVFAARVWCDEAEALVYIKKLNRTCLHASVSHGEMPLGSERKGFLGD